MSAQGCAAYVKNWKHTSHNGILLTFVNRTDFKVKGKFEQLLNGGVITQTITDGLIYDMLHSSEDNLWSVLLMTGYITKADLGEEGGTVRLKIPNREIASIFEDAVVELFKETVDLYARVAYRTDFAYRSLQKIYHSLQAGLFVAKTCR